MEAQRFSYIEIDPSFGVAGALPYVPITLKREGMVTAVTALVDSGSSLNVLPYDIGVQLGAVWEEQRIPIQLSGNLAESEARAMLVTATVGTLPAVRLAFAWTRNNRVPIILGQVNFFMEFDVCFFRARSVFEIKPKQFNGV